jgi:lipopolysaccharide export system permease protein
VLNITDRYVLRLIVRTYVPVCLGLCFLFLVGASFRLLEKEDLSLSQISLALPWVVPFLLPYLLPMAYAGTLALIFGRLVAENEVLAFGSLGIPARSLAWPALLFAAALSLLCTWLSATVAPHGHHMREEALRAVFQQLFELREGEHLSRTFPKQGFDLYVREYGPEQLEGLVLHYEKGGGVDSEPLGIQLVAQRGAVGSGSEAKRLELVLEDVDATITSSGEAPIRMHLERYAQGIDLGGRRRLKETDFSSASLRAQVEAGERRMLLAAASGGFLARREGRGNRPLEAGIELGMRTTLALGPLLMALLTLPVTLLLRARSPLVPFVASLVTVCVCYCGPLILGRELAYATASEWPAYLGVPASLLFAAALARAAASR